MAACTLVQCEIQRQNGELVADVQRAIHLVTESRDYLADKIENRKADWLPV